MGSAKSRYSSEKLSLSVYLEVIPGNNSAATKDGTEAKRDAEDR